MLEIKPKIRDFLSIYVGDGPWLDDEELVANSQLNSLFVMQLVIFLEEEFAIQLENDDLVLDNFETINNLAELVERKQRMLQP